MTGKDLKWNLLKFTDLYTIAGGTFLTALLYVMIEFKDYYTAIIIGDLHAPVQEYFKVNSGAKGSESFSIIQFFYRKYGKVTEILSSIVPLNLLGKIAEYFSYFKGGQKSVEIYNTTNYNNSSDCGALQWHNNSALQYKHK